MGTKTPSDEPLTVPFTVVIDTREQRPFEFAGLTSDARHGRRPLVVPTVVGTLGQGDYSLAGLQDVVAVERKSLADLYGTLGQGRERFERELERLAGLLWAAVVIEADWNAVLQVPVPHAAELDSLALWLNRFSQVPVAHNEPQAGLPAPDQFARWAVLLGDLLTGQPVRSQLNPKTIHRSVIAWQQRYPSIHWWFCTDRRLAEVTTFRILERWWLKHREGIQ